MEKLKKQFLNVLRDGDIVLINNTKFNEVSKGIQWFTGGDYNHCIWHVFKMVYHWTTWFAKKDPLKEFLKPEYKLCIMRYEDLYEADIDVIKGFAEKDVKNKKKYAKREYLGHTIVTMIAKIPWFGRKLARWLKRYKNPWEVQGEKVCSSGIVARWFNRAGIQLLPNISSGYENPEDIRQCKKLICVFEEKDEV